MPFSPNRTTILWRNECFYVRAHHQQLQFQNHYCRYLNKREICSFVGFSYLIFWRSTLLLLLLLLLWRQTLKMTISSSAPSLCLHIMHLDHFEDEICRDVIQLGDAKSGLQVREGGDRLLGVDFTNILRNSFMSEFP